LIQMENTFVFILLICFVYFNKQWFHLIFQHIYFLIKRNYQWSNTNAFIIWMSSKKANIYKQAEIQNPHITLQNANLWLCDLLQWLAYLFCNQLKLRYTYTEAHIHTYTHTLIQMYTLVWMILNIDIFINYECKWVSIH